MKNLKANLIKVTMLLAILFVAGAGVNTQAKAKPKLSSKKITIKVGQKKKLKVKNVKKKKVKWSTKNKAIATVNKKGKVVGKKKGKTTIIAKVGKKKLKCKVTVKKKSSTKKSSNKSSSSNKKLNLSKEIKKQLPYGDDYTTFYYPETLSLGTTTDLFKCVGNAGDTLPTPSNEIKLNYYKWYSSNPSVISIDKYGVATAHKEGKSKVYFKRVNKQGEWVTSKTGTITVKNLGNVTYTVAYGLNKDWVDLSPKYYEAVTKSMNQPGAYNYVNVTVTNNSDSPIVIENTFDIQTGSWWYFHTVDDSKTTIPAKSSKTILFRLSAKGGVFNTSSIYRFCLEYSIQNKDNGIYYYPDTNYYELW
ncbi:Bacterial Ig-like domain (group 2) [Eubacteriaceae bacterium CHKCI004]|nr:Bacterial Ig-like domain (group 2) [Eubacteriaceae bacterium CHKCI004]